MHRFLIISANSHPQFIKEAYLRGRLSMTSGLLIAGDHWRICQVQHRSANWRGKIPASFSGWGGSPLPIPVGFLVKGPTTSLADWNSGGSVTPSLLLRPYRTIEDQCPETHCVSNDPNLELSSFQFTQKTKITGSSCTAAYNAALWIQSVS